MLNQPVQTLYTQFNKAHDSRTGHKQAIQRIDRYLIKIKNQGMKIRPDTSLLDLWFDSDFVGSGTKKLLTFIELLRAKKCLSSYMMAVQ